MGFGSFLKKAINPLTPFKAIGGAAKNLARGNVAGALTGAATMGLGPSGGGGRLRDVRSMDPAAKDRMRAGFAGGPMGIGRMIAAQRGMMPQQGAPPPQMAEAGMAPPPQMAGPSPLQAGIQEMIGPQESDPYEAWKAGGRQGDRPAGY